MYRQKAEWLVKEEFYECLCVGMYGHHYLNDSVVGGIQHRLHINLKTQMAHFLDCSSVIDCIRRIASSSQYVLIIYLCCILLCERMSDGVSFGQIHK